MPGDHSDFQVRSQVEATRRQQAAQEESEYNRRVVSLDEPVRRVLMELASAEEWLVRVKRDSFAGNARWILTPKTRFMRRKSSGGLLLTLKRNTINPAAAPCFEVASFSNLSGRNGEKLLAALRSATGHDAVVARSAYG